MRRHNLYSTRPSVETRDEIWIGYAVSSTERREMRYRPVTPGYPTASGTAEIRIRTYRDITIFSSFRGNTDPSIYDLWEGS